MMSFDEAFYIGLCEDCDMDPAECYNCGICKYETSAELDN